MWQDKGKRNTLGWGRKKIGKKGLAPAASKREGGRNVLKKKRAVD